EAVLPVAPAGRGLTRPQRTRRSVARALAEHGLVEVLSYPFVGDALHDALGLPEDDPRRDALRLANPLSDEAPAMRTAILPTLLETVRRSVGRGASSLGVYQTGLVVLPGPADERVPAGIPDVRSRPSDAELKALDDAVPHQPRHVAGVMVGA